MKLNYNQVSKQVDKIKLQFNYQDKALFGKIQKIMSSPSFITCSVRFPGKTVFMSIGRGGEFRGVWPQARFVKSDVRVIDKFLEYLRKHLQGGTLKEVLLDQDDMLITLRVKKDLENDFSFFWKGKSLYFAHLYREKEEYCAFMSWQGHAKGIGDSIFDARNFLVKEFEKVGFKEVGLCKKDVDFIDFDLDSYEEDLLKISNKKINKRKKFLQRKIKNIEGDLGRVKKWRSLKDDVDSVDYQIPDGHKVVLYGQKFKFSKDLSEWKKRSLIYDKVKSLKLAEKILEERLDETIKYFENVDKNNSDSYELPTTVMPVWITKKAKETVRGEGGNISVYTLPSSLSVGVGSSDSANDYLRSKWASKSDLWFHIDGYPSAHLIVKTDSFNKLNEEDLRLIGSIISHYSSGSFDLPTLVYTQVKNLKGIKGKKGGVIMRKQKYISVSTIPDWKERISNICKH